MGFWIRLRCAALAAGSLASLLGAGCSGEHVEASAPGDGPKAVPGEEMFTPGNDVWLAIHVQGSGLVTLRPDGSDARVYPLPATANQVRIRPDAQEAVGGANLTLERIELASGKVEDLPASKSRQNAFTIHPRWLPDGRSVLFVRWALDAPARLRGDIMIAPAGANLATLSLMGPDSVGGTETRTPPPDMFYPFVDGSRLYYSNANGLVGCQYDSSTQISSDCVVVRSGPSLGVYWPATMGDAAPNASPVALLAPCAGFGQTLLLVAPEGLPEACSRGRILATGIRSHVPPALSATGHIAYVTSSMSGIDVVVVSPDGTSRIVFHEPDPDPFSKLEALSWSAPGSAPPSTPSTGLEAKP